MTIGHMTSFDHGSVELYFVLGNLFEREANRVPPVCVLGVLQCNTLGSRCLTIPGWRTLATSPKGTAHPACAPEARPSREGGRRLSRLQRLSRPRDSQFLLVRGNEKNETIEEVIEES